jgi:HlyD family secretion protein
MSSEINKATLQSIRRTLWVGGTTAGLLSFGIGGWAAMMELSGAIISPGVLVVDSNVKKVQHPTGGIVSELHAHEGEVVAAGDILIRLDDTVTRANVAVISKSIDELTARQARLQAEQNGQDRIVFPQELMVVSSDPRIAELMHDETHLFEIRAKARSGLVAQLRERIDQLRQQIAGLSDQIVAKKREVDLIAQELRGVRELWQKNLIQMTRLTALERESARLEGERGALVSSVAQTNAKISETELQIIQIDEDLRKDVGKELGEIRGKLSELVEKKVAAEDQLRRLGIKAPQDGVVHQLAVHTIGGVINPAELIMLIVPKSDALIVESRIAPQDIDQVQVGQQALLRFSAFNQRTTPELSGTVSLVSADVSQDQKTGSSFYLVRIRIDPEELSRLSGLKLVPGMPIECFIRTGERTVMSYLTKPIREQLNKAWRER